MPRKKKLETDNYYKAFPVAMRKLMNQRNITQNELAVHLGKTRQSISYYCDGSSSPDWETIAKIADYFCVSTDYLLGLTDDPNPIPSAVDALGLSPEAVNILMDDTLYGYVDDEIVFSNAAGHLKDVLNCLLESPNFCEIMANLLMSFNSFWLNSTGDRTEDVDPEYEYELQRAGYSVLKGNEAGRFYANEAGDCLKIFAFKEIPKLVESLIEAKRKSATVEATTMAEM
jgi:transcriptional regulator with XRE-family HTH domain